MITNTFFNSDVYQEIVAAPKTKITSPLNKIAEKLNEIRLEIENALAPLKVKLQDGKISFTTSTNNGNYYLHFYKSIREYASEISSKLDKRNSIAKFFADALSAKEKTAFYTKDNVTAYCSYSEYAARINIDIDIEFIPDSLIIEKISLFSKNNYRTQELFSSACKYLIASDWKAFPPIYDDSFKVESTSNTGTFKTVNGNFIYLPKITQKQYDEVLKSITIGKYKNKLISISDTTKSILYFRDGVVQQYDTKRLTNVSNRDIVTILDKPWHFLFSDSASGLSRHYNWVSYNPDIVTKYKPVFRDTKIGVLNSRVNAELKKEGIKATSDVKANTATIGDVLISFPDEVQEFITDLEDICETSYNNGNVLALTYLRFKGSIEVLKLCTKKAFNTKKKFIKDQTIFDSINSDNVIDLPNFNKEVSFFPHQAEALAKLDVAGSNAIIDVSVGGGKSLIIITDILNLLNKGKITRPLIVAPGTLIPQWVSQIQFFTNNQVNAFPITTEIVGTRGQENLESIINNCPPNTIFITTYSYLTTGKELIEGSVDSFTYSGTEWIQNVVKCDYIVLDESHKIKYLKTDYNKAVTILGQMIQYKRIATGTLINNKPEDLIGQCGFLDPSIIGSESEFKDRYYYRGQPKKNFADLCRHDLRTNTRYLLYRKKDYAALLPKVVYEPFFVDMTAAQQKIYKDMVKNIIEEIKNDPELRKAWEKLTSDGDDIPEIPIQILGKLAKLEQYLTAPEIHKLTTQIQGQEYISPKVEKMDELIADSIKKGGKVIVAVHYKEAAKHLMKYSKYQNQGIYYDASHKDALTTFVRDDECKVLFSVQQSLKEGLNLQCANRIIIADIDWTPGNAEQLEARINRPYIKWINGKSQNLNENREIYISSILVNNSADITKYIFQNYKRVRNSRIMENCPITELSKPDFSVEGLTAQIGDPLVGGQNNVNLIKDFENWQESEIEAVRVKGNLQFKQPSIIKNLSGSKKVQNLPWISGMELEYDSKTEIPLVDYAEQFDIYLETRDLRDISDKLEHKVVRTEFGYGTILSVVTKGRVTKATKVNVKPFNSEKVTCSMHVVLVLPDTSVQKAMELQARENIKASGKTTLNKEKLVQDEIKKLAKGNNYKDKDIKVSTPKREKVINDVIQVAGYGEIEVPTGRVTLEKVNEMLNQIEMELRTKKGNYHFNDLLNKVHSTPVENNINNKTYEEWLRAAIKFRKEVIKYQEKKEKKAPANSFVYGDKIIEFPKLANFYNKIVYIYREFGFRLKYSYPKGTSAIIIDTQTNSKSKPIDLTDKKLSYYSLEEWLEMALDLRKQVISNQKRVNNIPDIPIPTKNGHELGITIQTVNMLFKKYAENIVLGKTTNGKTQYYISDKLSKVRMTLDINLPRDYTWEQWIKLFFKFKKNLENNLIKKGLMTPSVETTIPDTDEPVEKKIVVKKGKVSITEGKGEALDSPEIQEQINNELEVSDNDDTNYNENEFEETETFEDNFSDEDETSDNEDETSKDNVTEDENDFNEDENDVSDEIIEDDFSDEDGNRKDASNNLSTNKLDTDDDDEEEDEEQDTPEKDYKIDLGAGVYNGILSLYAPTIDPDAESLLPKGFRDVPPVWKFRVLSKEKGYLILEKLSKKYEIFSRCLTEAHTILDSMVKAKYPHDFPQNEIRNWIKLNRKQVEKGKLKIYPMVVNKKVYLVVDSKIHKGINLTSFNFEKDDPYHIYFAQNKSDFKAMVKKIQRTLEISNWEEFEDSCDILNIDID